MLSGLTMDSAVVVFWVLRVSPHPTSGSFSAVGLLLWVTPAPFWLVCCDSFLRPSECGHHFLRPSAEVTWPVQTACLQRSGTNPHRLFLASFALSNRCQAVVSFLWPEVAVAGLLGFCVLRCDSDTCLRCLHKPLGRSPISVGGIVKAFLVTWN